MKSLTSAEATGQAKQKEQWVSFFMQDEGLPQKPDFEDQGDLWRSQRPGKAETE